MSIKENSEWWLLDKYPFLSEYEDYLPLSKIEITWEWNYCIIINWPSERVYKIWKNSEFSKDLEREYQNHLRFYLGLEKLLETVKINKWICIPEVAEKPKIIEWKLSGEKLFIYEMERVNWKNLLSYLIKEELEKLGVTINFDNNTDLSLEKLYISKTWGNIDDLRNWIWINIENEGKKFIKSIKKWQKKWVWSPFPSYLFQKYFPEQYELISELLFRLKKSGYKHLDLHAKNIMIAYENKKPIIYIIDFWIVNINSNI